MQLNKLATTLIVCTLSVFIDSISAAGVILLAPPGISDFDKPSAFFERQLHNRLSEKQRSDLQAIIETAAYNDISSFQISRLIKDRLIQLTAGSSSLTLAIINEIEQFKNPGLTHTGLNNLTMLQVLSAIYSELTHYYQSVLNHKYDKSNLVQINLRSFDYYISEMMSQSYWQSKYKFHDLQAKYCASRIMSIAKEIKRTAEISNTPYIFPQNYAILAIAIMSNLDIEPALEFDVRDMKKIIANYLFKALPDEGISYLKLEDISSPGFWREEFERINLFSQPLRDFINYNRLAYAFSVYLEFLIDHLSWEITQRKDIEDPEVEQTVFDLITKDMRRTLTAVFLMAHSSEWRMLYENFGYNNDFFSVERAGGDLIYLLRHCLKHKISLPASGNILNWRFNESYNDILKIFEEFTYNEERLANLSSLYWKLYVEISGSNKSLSHEEVLQHILNYAEKYYEITQPHPNRNFRIRKLENSAVEIIKRQFKYIVAGIIQSKEFDFEKAASYTAKEWAEKIFDYWILSRPPLPFVVRHKIIREEVENRIALDVNIADIRKMASGARIRNGYTRIINSSS